MVLLVLDQTPPERNSGQIFPAILFLFAHKSEFADGNAPASLVLRPTVASGQDTPVSAKASLLNLAMVRCGM